MGDAAERKCLRHTFQNSSVVPSSNGCILFFSPKRSSLVMVTSQKTLKICFLSFVVTMALLVFFLILSLHRVILSPKQRTIILLLKPFLCIISTRACFTNRGAHCSMYVILLKNTKKNK